MSNRASSKRMRRNIIIGSIIVVFAIVFIVMLVILLGKGKNGVGIGDNHKVEYVETEVVHRFNKMSDMKVSTKDMLANVNYINSGDNATFVKIRIKLADSKELIYESEMLKPGDTLDQIKLNIPDGLVAGEHNIKVYIDNYASENDKESEQGIIQTLKLTIE